MAHGFVSEVRPELGLSSHPQQARSALSCLASTLALWAERSSQRKALAALERHHLRDIGVTREEARHEAEKPFWR
jgi:uncharacterized protein YjiS (DUF1127 family)